LSLRRRLGLVLVLALALGLATARLVGARDPKGIFVLAAAVLLGLGVMDLRAMALVMLAISAERLAPAGERVARAIGAISIATGLLLMACA